MKSEIKRSSFMLFLTDAVTAKTFYSNGFWELSEQTLAYNPIIF